MTTMLFVIWLLIVIALFLLLFLLPLSIVVGVIIFAVRNRTGLIKAAESFFTFVLSFYRRIWYNSSTENQKK